MLDKWLKRLEPEQQDQLEALYQAYCENMPETDLAGFEVYLAQQGWIFPGQEQAAVETLLETVTAYLYPPGQQELEVQNLFASREVYTQLKTLGVGDMGQVDLVRENSLQRKVAMKRIKAGEDPRFLKRFLIEAQLTAQLDHPHILPIYTLENTPEGLAYTMKRVQGRTFAELIEQARQGQTDFDLFQRMEFFLAVCEAMDYAHSQGVVHRELEPANLMVGNFQDVYVMNWGSARRLPEICTLDVVLPQFLEQMGTQMDSSLAGNLAYYSPEQAKGEWDQLDLASDIYVLGLILYEWASLSPALSASSPVGLLEKAAKANLNALTHFKGKRLPVDLKAIIQKATALKPQARYPNVRALSHDLQAFLRGESVSAHRDTPWQAASRWLVHHQWLALSTAVTMVVLVAALGLWSLWSQQQELARVRSREQAINRFLGAVYTQSRKMNRQFLRSESQLESLVSAATAHLTQETPHQDRYYLHGKFTPPELIASRQFHSQISIDWPLSVKSHKIPEAQVADELATIAGLRQFQQRLLLQSKSYQPLSQAQKKNLIANTGTTVSYATLVLKQGAGAWLPGGEFKAENYDPTQRYFYKFGFQQHKRRWGSPYIDVSGAGLLLIAATGIFDHQQQFLGTASLDVKFDTIIQAMLDLPRDLRQLRGGYIVDDQGNIAIHSRQKGKTFSATIHPDLKLSPYPHPKVVKAIQQQLSGHSVIAGPKPLLVAYYRLPALGWYYVVEAELSEILR